MRLELQIMSSVEETDEALVKGYNFVTGVGKDSCLNSIDHRSDSLVNSRLLQD